MIFVPYQELRENGTGCLVGSSVTLADVGLLHLLAGVDYFGDAFFEKYPDVKVNCGLDNYCDCLDNCVNHFLHCNGNCWTNRKCKCTHLVQYNLLLND